MTDKQIIERIPDNQRRGGKETRATYVTADDKEWLICNHVPGSGVFYDDIRFSNRRDPKLENRGKLGEQ